MSLEVQNKELQTLFEPQKQRNKRINILFQILPLDPLYFQQVYLVHFSFILNDF
jgi:hypothetical protein